MIEEWMAFCVRKGVTFEAAAFGVDILNERDPDGKQPNVDYYGNLGWPALLKRVEEEHGT